MRVLNIPNFYYPNIGGIEQTARDLTNSLLEMGVTEQKVLCVNRLSRETAIDKVDGVEVIRCGCTAKIASQCIAKDFKPQLEKLMNEFKPTVVVVHWPNPFTLANVMKYADRGFKLVIYWHSDIVKQKILGKLFLGLEDKAAKRADMLIATSPNYIEGSRVLKKYRDKSQVIPSCIDPKRFEVTEEIQNRADELSKKHSGKTLCFTFGRPVPYKGFKYLEEAKKYLPNDIEIVRGERLSQEELIAYLVACDIFCFPSITKNEAFGLSLAEGLYFAKPAVTFNIPGSGVNYVSLDKVTGIECPNRDAKAYADAISLLARDKELRNRLGENAKERVLENFTYEKYKKNICDKWMVLNSEDNRDSKVCV